jgi:hypothetical protein
MTDRPYPEGLDYVWLALDAKGHLGAFTTAGVGPIPLQALNNEVGPIDCLEDAVLELPKISEARLLATSGDLSSFVALAERGLFVYDWDDVHQTRQNRTNKYELQVAPHNPLRAGSLPKELALFVASVRLGDVDFSDCLSVDPRVYMECASDK